MTDRHGRRLLTTGTSLALAMLVACTGATSRGTPESADQYPSRPITWIVAFDPGGGSDIEARRVQQSLQKKLGTSIQIQYRAGGGGAVGWSELVAQSPDGYTVGGLVIPHIIIQPLALSSTGYTTEDIRPVAWNVSAPAALMVAEDSRFKTMEQFVTFAKEHPGNTTIGGVETFSASDLALAELVKSSGIEVNYVPITGGAGPLLTSLRGGHIDAVLLSTAHAVRTDGVRALAIGGAERLPTLPGVPTFAELGYEITIGYAWGVGMPAGASDAIARKFGNAVIEVMREPGMTEALLKEGLVPVLVGPDKAGIYMTGQKGHFEKLVPLVRDLSR